MDEDPVDPRLQARPRLEPGETFEDGEPGLLDDILGRGAGSEERAGEPEEAFVMPVQEGGEGALVPGEEGGE